MTVHSTIDPAEIIIRGRHTDLTDRFRLHAAEAAEKLDRFGIPLQRIEIEITHEHNPRRRRLIAISPHSTVLWIVLSKGCAERQIVETPNGVEPTRTSSTATAVRKQRSAFC